jgi:hypothetical protein
LEHNRALGIERSQLDLLSPFVFDVAKATPLFLADALDANALK